RFDSFIAAYPLICRLADFGYRVLQKIDKNHHVARYAKRSSKTYLRCSEVIEKRAIEHARHGGFDMVCCGHTHMAIAKPVLVGYFNSGCWTELPCSYLTVENGEVQVHSVTAEAEETAELVPTGL